MEDKKWNILYTPIITPFNSNGNDIDWDSLEQILTRQLNAAIKGIVLLGTTGEAPTISLKERIALIKFCREILPNTILVVGTSSNCTKTAIKLTQEADDLGADAVMIAAPYYNKPTAQGILQHYSAIHNATNVPIFLYNIPSRTGINITDEITIKLAALSRIVAIKDSSGDASRIISLRHFLKESGLDLTILSGEDVLHPALVAMGAEGGISAAANIAPKTLVRLFNLLIAEKKELALEIQVEMYALYTALFQETNPIGVKYMAWKIGAISHPSVREPLTELSTVVKEKLDNITQIKQHLLQ